MADNLRRAHQNIDLGANDDPIPLPIDVANQAAAENRFVIVGRPLLPRQQNLHSIVVALPRLWGQAGLIHGRVVEGRRFQFVFSTEESMETVLRRGPWAFAERLLVLQHWSPLMNLNILKFIPFWIQIRGIPLQFMNQEVIAHIGRVLGQLMDIDYNAVAAAQVEYVRVRLNWDVAQPLHFHRQFQFTPGVNTLLRFCYERLCGFCEACDLLTHDSGNFLIQNGGGGHHSDSDDSDDDNPNPGGNNNQGIHIQEIDNGVNVGPEQNGVDMNLDNVQDHEALEETDAGEEEQLGTMYSNELEMNEIYNPCPNFSNATGDIPGGLVSPISVMKPEQNDMDDMEDLYEVYAESVEDTRHGQRKRKHEGRDQEDKFSKTKVFYSAESSGTAGSEEDNIRGAVGPNPPEPP